MHIFLIRYTLAQSVENTAAGSFGAATDTVLCHRFSGYAGDRIYLTVAQCLVSIEDPCHFTRTGSVVGSRNVNTGANEVLFYQFGCVAPCDILELVNGVLTRIDTDSSLGASEWYVYQCTFIGHKSSQCHHFVLINRFSVADTALRWQPVVTVLHAIGFDNFIIIANLNREANLKHEVTRFDLLD